MNKFCNITVKVEDDNHCNAITNVCAKHDYPCDIIENNATIYAEFDANSVSAFFMEIDNEREEMMKVDISLTNRQKEVVEQIVHLLADNGIGLAHDYFQSGELMAFNSHNGTVMCVEDGNDNGVKIIGTRGRAMRVTNSYDNKVVYSFYTGEFGRKC